MLTLQRPLISSEAEAGPSRLPAQNPKIQAPTPRRTKIKDRSPSYSPSGSSIGSPRPPPTPRVRAATTPSRPPSRTERRYSCIHPGCDKAYFKPSRLKEHELTHTGERPHNCPYCDQTYLRASHLTAHMRTHLPSSARSFACTYEGCDKAFWTATHLKRHQAMHEQVEIYPCPHCDAKFHKANQLRDHHAASHMPAGTKSFPCPHEDCDASFTMRQQLKAHEKTHDSTRYTCSHPSHAIHPSFPTWSALQSHLKSEHPPQCPHDECGGKTFKSAHKLKDHLKVHALRAEDHIRRSGSCGENGDGGEVDNMGEGRAGGEKKRRRRSSAVGEIGEGRKRRKIVKILEAGQDGEIADLHTRAMNSSSVTISHTHTSPALNQVDILTGPATSRSLGDMRRYGCPIQYIPLDSLPMDGGGKHLTCYARFWRVYDVRRHLSSGHGVELGDEEVRELLIQAKAGGQEEDDEGGS